MMASGSTWNFRRRFQRMSLGNPGWRATVRATVAGSHFESIKLDVVARPGEIDGGVEKLELAPLLPGIAGHRAVSVLAVDVNQHAAEKLHAYSRIYVLRAG
jgi:nucleotidyltransferase AbiEii toxin of type IV toxin-antitoxin system